MSSHNKWHGEACHLTDANLSSVSWQEEPVCVCVIVCGTGLSVNVCFESETNQCRRHSVNIARHVHLKKACEHHVAAILGQTRCPSSAAASENCMPNASPTVVALYKGLD